MSSAMLPMGSAELAYNRADIAQLFQGTVLLVTASYASDGQGGSVQTWGTSGTVAGRVRQMSGAEMEAGGGIVGVQQYELYVPWDTVLHLKDRVKNYGRTFEITDISPDSPWQLDQTARVVEIT